MNDLCDAYFEDRQAKPVRRPKTISQRLKPIRAFFGAGPASTITPQRVRAYVNARRKEGLKPSPGVAKPREGVVKDSTIDGELRALRQALHWGEKNGWFPNARAPHVETPGQGVPRRRFLLPSEVERLVTALEAEDTFPHTRTLVLIALLTAQRGGAIKELRWEDHIDFERGVIWFPPPVSRLKNRVSVKMGAALAAHLLQEHDLRECEWVVHWRALPIASARKAFGAVVRRAGLIDVTFHDLRRTAASLAIMRGSSFAEVAALLGDEEAVVRQHYAMFSPEFLSGILEKIEGIAYAQTGRNAPDEIARNASKQISLDTESAENDQ